MSSNVKSGKLLNHPDREEIIKKLVDGVSPNKVSVWLEEKYPLDKDKQYQITPKALSEFRSKHLDLNKDAIKILKKERERQKYGLPAGNPNAGTFLEFPDETLEEQELRIKQTLLQTSPTYQEKLKEISEATLDGPRLIKELATLIQSRLEVYFNAVASGTTVGESLKADKQFAEYVSLLKDLVKDAKKIEEDYNAQPDSGHVQLNIVHEQIGIIRDTVKELLQEIAPELALEFIDRLNKKMLLLHYEAPKAPDILKQVDKINKHIEKIKKDEN